MSQLTTARTLGTTLAVVPATVVALLELVRLSYGLGGATAFAQGLVLGWVSLALATIVLVLSAAAFFAGATWNDGSPATPGLRRLQFGAGTLAWAFIAFHLVNCWLSLDAVGAEPLGQYEFLRNLLSLPINLAIYVFGLGVTSLYLVQGSAAVLEAWGFADTPLMQKRVELVLGAFACIVFVFAVNVLSHFAAGRALFVTTPSEATQVAPTADGEVR